MRESIPCSARFNDGHIADAKRNKTLVSDGRPTHIDLFSGIGGFALAAQWAGFRTIAFCEIDPYCRRIIEQHWPNVPIWSDIKDIGFTDWGIQECDLITGGFPCQPFSVAGEQRGQEDDRYLWPEMLRVISESKPNWVIGENVAAIDGLALDDCISGLESIGYEVAPPLEIPACGVGAWHNRNRVWIIANAAGRNVQESEMVEPERCYGESRRATGVLPCPVWQPRRETYLTEMAGAVHGVSNWVDRSKGLGNAIVPQVAYEILREIRNLI